MFLQDEEANPHKKIKSSGIARFVILSNNVIVLFLNENDDFFEEETVYDISTNEYLGTSVEKIGKTSVFKNNSYLDISALMLQENVKFILSDNERAEYKEFLKNA